LRAHGLFFPVDPAPMPRWRHGGDARLGDQRGALRRCARTCSA
jgi:hypothetical protein